MDKEEYWKNRRAGKRGQNGFNPIVAHHTAPDWPIKSVTKKAKLKNTRRARKAVKYAVVYTDENWIDSNYHDTPEAAIAEWEKVSGLKFEDHKDSHQLQGFTTEEISKIDAYSEAHPQ